MTITVMAWTGTYASAAAERLGSLDLRSNGNLKQLRKDVRTAIYVVKSGRTESELPELRFYQYTVKKGDSFWTILSKSSLDMDTIMSVNNLSSPSEIKPGMTIYLPNMRGVIIKGRDEKSAMKILEHERIAARFVHRINKKADFDKEYLFVPCGKISGVERSLFLGTAFINPLSAGRRSSGFGTRRDPFDRNRLQFHSGIDIACAINSRILAARDGRVVFTGYRGGYGNLVIIRHEHGYESYYGHLSRYTVKTGDAVGKNTLIGYSGNTGRTTGPHLHFEVRKGTRPINPGVLIGRK
jgi:murein DD-endopeptidase MepM/ murein hydrolase activator NlpD